MGYIAGERKKHHTPPQAYVVLKIPEMLHDVFSHETKATDSGMKFLVGFNGEI